MKALMTRLPEGYMLIECWLSYCAYSAQCNPVILMKVNQSVTTALTELTGDFLPRSSRAVNISRVMGLRCLAMLSSLSLARMILEHMFGWSDKSVGMSKQRQWNKVMIVSTYTQTVAEQELWSNMSCLIKHAMILSYPAWLPQGSGIFLLLQNSM